MMTVRILIVDDRAVVRQELHSVLELLGDVTVVGEAVDGWDAIHQAGALQPDLVLMDLEMPGLDGFEATRQIKALHLAQRVIVLTVHGDDISQQKALAAGADAFIVKGSDLRTMLDQIELSSPSQ
jgi:DNA-binding NarL/FixJ family response regulator